MVCGNSSARPDGISGIDDPSLGDGDVPVKNILKIREKVFQDTSPLVVALEKEKSLQQFAAEESKLRKFWQGVFGQREPVEG